MVVVGQETRPNRAHPPGQLPDLAGIFSARILIPNIFRIRIFNIPEYIRILLALRKFLFYPYLSTINILLIKSPTSYDISQLKVIDNTFKISFSLS